jgi:chromosomal replication initiator protein
MHREIWNNCLKVIKDNVPSISYRTWFEPIIPLKLENNILTIQVPSPFFYEYLEEKYIEIISKTLRKELGYEARLEYNVVMEYNAAHSKKPLTLNLPAQNHREIKNRPVSVHLNA